MKKVALLIGFFLLFSPAFALAATPSCSAQGYTVVFVNGVFDTKIQARDNANALWFQLGHQYNSQDLTVRLGYNPSHLAGAGDLAESTAQLFSTSISNFDLTTILMQVYPEVTTRKLLLVGHSQGALYTNSMYDYLLSHGEPHEAVAVYNVASPATYTAGGGKYINSSGDTLLASLRALHFSLLPSNVDLTPANLNDAFPGHSFAGDYLANASTQMLADINGEMSALQSVNATDSGDCFTPPVASLGYKTAAAAFAVADPTAVVLKAGTVTVVKASEVALAAASKLAIGALQFFADTVIVTAQPPSPAQADAKTVEVVNKLYGSSLNGLSAQDKKELLGSSQGGAVVLAVAPPKAVLPGAVLGTSTEVGTGASTTLLVPKNIFPESANGPIVGGGGGGGPAPVVSTEVIEQTITASTPDPAPADTSEVATTTESTESVTPPPPDPAPVVAPSSIIASQTDFSGTPIHYWHSDGTDGTFLILDPNDNKPGFSLGALTAATSTVLGIHIKAKLVTSGSLGPLPKIPYLYDESNNHSYACAQESFNGVAYSTAADALLRQNALAAADYDNNMKDMYFTCAAGTGHENLYADSSYRLFFSPLSTADVFDIYVAANAAGDKPFFEITSDGTY